MRIAGFLFCSLAMDSAVAQATWTVDRTPILDLVGIADNGATRFENPAGGTLLANGWLLVADRGPVVVRLLDPAGRQAKSIGRAGEGPGEFRAMLWAGRCGRDSLVVWDPVRRRATFVDSSKVGAQITIPSGAGARLRGPLLRIACGSGRMGYLADPDAARPATTENVLRMLSSIVVAGRDGRVLWTKDSVTSSEIVRTVSPEGQRSWAPRPLGFWTEVAFAGDRLVVGTSDSARLLVYAADGSHRSIALPIDPAPPTAAERDAAIMAMVTMAPARLRQAFATQLRAVPSPKLRPAFSGLYDDPSGAVWVQVNPLGGKPIDLVLVTAEGKVTARAQVPIPMAIWEIGANHVLGTYTDSNDEPHIVAFRLRRPGTR